MAPALLPLVLDDIKLAMLGFAISSIDHRILTLPQVRFSTILANQESDMLGW
jgi:hypothetical protein